MIAQRANGRPATNAISAARVPTDSCPPLHHKFNFYQQPTLIYTGSVKKGINSPPKFHLLHSQTLTPNLSSSPLNPLKSIETSCNFSLSQAFILHFPLNFRESKLQRYVFCSFHYQEEKGLSF
jgi:hypothetical protein